MSFDRPNPDDKHKTVSDTELNEALRAESSRRPVWISTTSSTTRGSVLPALRGMTTYAVLRGTKTSQPATRDGPSSRRTDHRASPIVASGPEADRGARRCCYRVSARELARKSTT